MGGGSSSSQGWPTSTITLLMQSTLGPRNSGALGRLLKAGVTTVFLATIPEEQLRELKPLTASAESPFPRFFTAISGMTAPGGVYPVPPAPEIAPVSPESARIAIRRIKDAGADAIKIIYDDMGYSKEKPFPAMKREVMAALIDEAHKLNLKAFVHAPRLRFAKEALAAGADAMLHGILCDRVDHDFISLMRKNRATYITTHSVWEAMGDLRGWLGRLRDFESNGPATPLIVQAQRNLAGVQQLQRWACDIPDRVKACLPILRSNLKRVSDSGIPVANGSDTGYGGVILGVSSQMELVLQVEAGLSPTQAICAATGNAQALLGREKEVGTIEVGKLADFVVLDADPLMDVRNIRKIYAVVKGGVVH